MRKMKPDFGSCEGPNRAVMRACCLLMGGVLGTLFVEMLWHAFLAVYTWLGTSVTALGWQAGGVLRLLLHCFGDLGRKGSRLLWPLVMSRCSTGAFRDVPHTSKVEGDGLELGLRSREAPLERLQYFVLWLGVRSQSS